VAIGLGLQAGIALDPVLHFDGAAHRIDDTAELDDAPVARALDDPAMMDRDCWVDEIAAEGSEARSSSAPASRE
jgi:hypothetical protein